MPRLNDRLLPKDGGRGARERERLERTQRFHLESAYSCESHQKEKVIKSSEDVIGKENSISGLRVCDACSLSSLCVHVRARLCFCD